jgi:hypothetical protein
MPVTPQRGRAGSVLQRDPCCNAIRAVRLQRDTRGPVPRRARKPRCRHGRDRVHTEERARAPPGPRRTRHRKANGGTRPAQAEVDLGAAGTLGGDRIHRDHARGPAAARLVQGASVTVISGHARGLDSYRSAVVTRARGGPTGAHELCGRRWPERQRPRRGKRGCHARVEVWSCPKGEKAANQSCASSTPGTSVAASGIVSSQPLLLGPVNVGGHVPNSAASEVDLKLAGNLMPKR